MIFWRQIVFNLTKEYLASDLWASVKSTVNCLEGFGWWEEKDLPSLEELDDILGDTPAIFHRRCLHIIYMNSAAIKALELDSPKFEKKGNVDIIRDKNGKSTGILKEGFEMVRKSYLKNQTLETQKRQILAGLKCCIGKGVCLIKFDT